MSEYTDYGELLERNRDVVADEEREAELVDYLLEQRSDRLGRDAPARMWCAVCGEKPGRSIYGMKCQGCFDAQREEREQS